jgi:hypothetical protein
MDGGLFFGNANIFKASGIFQRVERNRTHAQSIFQKGIGVTWRVARHTTRLLSRLSLEATEGIEPPYEDLQSSA